MDYNKFTLANNITSLTSNYKECMEITHIKLNTKK